MATGRYAVLNSTAASLNKKDHPKPRKTLSGTPEGNEPAATGTLTRKLQAVRTMTGLESVMIIVTESFTGSSGAVSDPPWRNYYDQSVGRYIARDGAGRGIGNTGGVDNAAWWDANIIGPDQYAQVVPQYDSTSGAFVEVMVRASGRTSDNTAAAYWFWNNGQGNCALYKQINYPSGTGAVAVTLITAASTIPFTSGVDVFRLEVRGTTLRAFKNGTAIIWTGGLDYFIDTSIASGSPGVVTDGNFLIDNWEGGNLSAASLTRVITTVGPATRSLTGAEPAATGVLTRIKQGVRTLTGSEPNATAVLTRIKQGVRSLTGIESASTAVLTRIKQGIRSLTGAEPAQTGVLTRAVTKVRSLTGVEAVGGAVFADTFHRADSDTIGGNWTEPFGDWAIIGSGLRAIANEDAIQDDAWLLNSTSIGTADYRVVANITGGSGFWSGSHDVGVLARSPAPNRGYLLVANSFNQLQMFMIDGSGFHQLGSTVGLSSPADPFTLAIKCTGSSISGELNGATLIGPITDTTYATEGDFGLRVWNSPNAPNHLINSLTVTTGTGPGSGGTLAVIHQSTQSLAGAQPAPTGTLVRKLQAVRILGGAAAAESFFPSNPIPTGTPESGTPFELGLMFTPKAGVTGTLSGVRFYRTLGDTQDFTISLYHYNGSVNTLLARKVQSSSASGWQTILFDSPVSVYYDGGFAWSITYWSSSGQFNRTSHVFDSPGIADTTSLHAYYDTEGGAVNGAFETGTPDATFGATSFEASSYHIDVLYTPSGVGANAEPAPTGSLTGIKGGVTRSLAGTEPASTGALTRRLQAVRALTGAEPAASGALTRVKTFAPRTLVGSEPAATGALTRLKTFAPRTLAGSEPSATAILASQKITARTLVGSQPAETGTLVRRLQAVRSLVGSLPAPTGALARVPQFIRSLSGAEPAASAVLTRLKTFVPRTLAGSEPFATGALTRIKAFVPRTLTGSQPNETGALVRGVKASTRTVAGAEPFMTGALAYTRQGVSTRSLASQEPTGTATLVRLVHWGRALAGGATGEAGALSLRVNLHKTLVGAEPYATGSLQASKGATKVLTGAQPAPTGTLIRVKAATRTMAGSQPGETGTLSRLLQATRLLVGSEPYPTGTSIRLLILRRLLAGAEPYPSGDLRSLGHAERVIVGVQPSPSGEMTWLYMGSQAITAVRILRVRTNDTRLPTGRATSFILAPTPDATLVKGRATGLRRRTMTTDFVLTSKEDR